MSYGPYPLVHEERGVFVILQGFRKSRKFIKKVFK